LRDASDSVAFPGVMMHDVEVGVEGLAICLYVRPARTVGSRRSSTAPDASADDIAKD
jgi:hypothetical protein